MTFLFLDQDFPAWQNWFDRASRSFIYRPWPYLILAIAGFVLSVYWLFRNSLSQQRSFILILTLSGLMSSLPLFVFTPAADYRYVLWLVCSSLLATIVLVIEISNRKYTADEAAGRS